MAIVTTDDKHYKEIAQAIRHRGASEKQYTPEEMADGVYAACDVQYTEGVAAGYSMGFEAQHNIKTGTFSPAEDTVSISLDIPAGAKMVEIIPEGIPSKPTGSRIPVHYLFASKAFQNHNAAFENLGIIVQYFYDTRFYTNFYPFDTSNGFSMTCDPGLVFEGNMTYKWLAHYWPE